MVFKCFVIFLNVIIYGFAATVVSDPKHDDVEGCLADGCKSVAERYADASMLKALLKPTAKPLESNAEANKGPVLPFYEGNLNHAGCRLRLHPQYLYECLSKKGQYYYCNGVPLVSIAPGTEVKITRRGADNTNPVSVHVTCGLNGTYNANLKCMGEIEQLQKELNDLSKNKMNYKKQVNQGSEHDSQEKKSILNYNEFMSQVHSKLGQIQRKMEECDIYIHLFLNQFDVQILSSFEETDRVCDLPPYPKHGHYVITKSQVPSLVPADTADLFVLHYVCDRGFTLIGTKSPRCVNGVWLDEFPQCSVACKLPKKFEFIYQCPINDQVFDVCDDHVTVGSVVKVSRLRQANATAAILCRGDGTFNISTDCVEEIEDYERESENTTMEKMIYYENKFSGFKGNPESYEFEQLVLEFQSFKKSVEDNLQLMHQKAEECDIYLELLLP